MNAHGYDQVPMHKLDDQRAVIMKSMDIIEKFCGKRPRGWFGPGLTQTFDTLDHLAEAGVEYIGDWVLDDEPVTLKTTGKPVVALPYNFEIHDIVMMALQHHPSEVWHSRAMDHFNTLYAESAERPKIMALACHPYLSGVPHRIGHVQRTFADILAHDGVVAWNGEQILDWYLGARGKTAA
jgi:peptidoglycan/xylan/chitin deacetylase (PgdA/CDA1 family)